MLDTFKKLIADQYEAVFCTLNTCIDRCPDSGWHAPVRNHLYCQSVFHAMFYADFYLGQDQQSFKQQPFHRDNQQFFGDYEELEDRKPEARYEKGPIKGYLEHCRGKAAQVLAAATAETLAARSAFEWLDFSCAEVHVYNIRHLQHHAAQLSLRLRMEGDIDVPWVRSGWRRL